MIEKCRKLMTNCFEGDVTLPKLTLWMTVIACLSMGVAYGLLMAPWTRGVTIGSNNGHENCSFGADCRQKGEEEK